MKKTQSSMNPLDLLVLLKIVSKEDQNWKQTDLAEELYISQSEVSKSLARSRFARLLNGKRVSRLALMGLLEYGVPFVFPQQLGPIVKGIPTAHSAYPLNEVILSNKNYVWPSGIGKVKGQSILPLYPTVPKAVESDPNLYELLSLVDALRVGKAREKEIAIKELKTRIIDEKKAD
ncbi:MAG: hypothetical protein R3B93_01100 [Bacteroidia bacterium]